MDCSTLAVLFSLLFSLGTAAPLPVEVLKMKSKVKWMAEQLVVRLDGNSQVRAGLPRSGAAHDLDGISSIVVVLEGYNSLISETLHGVAQIKYDISSLTGYLVHWKLGHCSEQRPKPPVPGPLQELQSQKEHVDTVSPEALVRVKDFVKQLLKNLSQLEMC